VKVVIVDDEPLARSAIRGLVAEDPELTVAGECSGVDAAEMIRREQPDILFLDIQMPEVDGFQVIEQIGLNAVPAVIFVTAYDEHALRAFEVHALDYLVKPFDDRRFFAALLRAKDHARKRETPRERVARFLVRNGEKVLFIKTEEIDWIEAADYYVSLHAGGKTHLLRRSMAEIEADLDPGRFVRVHRSAIVNLDRVRELRAESGGESAVVLRDGTRVPVSRRRREQVAEALRASAR